MSVDLLLDTIYGSGGLIKESSPVSVYFRQRKVQNLDYCIQNPKS